VQMGSSLHHGLIGPAASLSIIKICSRQSGERSIRLAGFERRRLPARLGILT